MRDREQPLRIFVYGTLKTGGRAHSHFCAEAIHIEPGTVLGKLYALPAGYPMLAIPNTSILAVGTADVENDLSVQQHFAEAQPTSAPSLANEKAFDMDESTEWTAVEGEIISFESPRILKALDSYEGFTPGARGLYSRVLVRPLSPDAGPVWTYAAPDKGLPAGAIQIGSRWP